jgi:ABC-type uncharacterized transport system substrate-binding protein
MARQTIIVVWLVTLVTLSLASFRLAKAQQTKKVPRIGFLSSSSPSSARETIGAFRQGLRDLGYIEGQNIAIEQRYAEGVTERLPNLATELVRLKVDVILTPGTADTLATKNATTTIPIVMSNVDDPVAFGLIDSLARPGGNITGLSSGAGPGLYGKRLELLKESFPRVSRVAVLWNPDDPGSVINVRGMEAPARSLSLKLQSVEMREPKDLEQAFSAMKRERAEVLVTILSALVGSQRSRIVDLAAKSRLATMCVESQWVGAGGLMSYGPSYSELFRRAATYVDKILKGAKPADLPVEQPTKFEFVINLKTAKKIGLTIPPNVLVRADKVIR